MVFPSQFRHPGCSPSTKVATRRKEMVQTEGEEYQEGCPGSSSGNPAGVQYILESVKLNFDFQPWLTLISGSEQQWELFNQRLRSTITRLKQLSSMLSLSGDHTYIHILCDIFYFKVKIALIVLETFSYRNRTRFERLIKKMNIPERRSEMRL